MESVLQIEFKVNQILSCSRLHRNQKALILGEYINQQIGLFCNTKIEQQVFNQIFKDVTFLSYESFIRQIIRAVFSNRHNSTSELSKIVCFCNYAQDNSKVNIGQLKLLMPGVLAKIR